MYLLERCLSGDYSSAASEFVFGMSVFEGLMKAYEYSQTAA